MHSRALLVEISIVQIEKKKTHISNSRISGLCGTSDTYQHYRTNRNEFAIHSYVYFGLAIYKNETYIHIFTVTKDKTK